MKLDIAPLEKAIGQLQKSLTYLNSEMARQDENLREQFRGAAIQAFEYTYELGLKMLRRQLEQIVSNPAEIREMNFLDFIRAAAEAGLVKDVPGYRLYREKRNITSHTYDLHKAEELLDIMDGFMLEMRFLLTELKKRNRA
jgi:nucleotidyltransferase substrate binding protein (TIGR01987 family)